MNGALLRESLAAARSQAVASVLTILMVGGMCAAALLTTGRTVAAEEAVLAKVDTSGTRSILVRGNADAGLTVALLNQLRAVQGVAAVTGFGPTVDARNIAVPGGRPVALRDAYGDIGAMPGHAREHPAGPVALASPTAARALGLHDGVGGLVTDDGRDVVAAGSLTAPAQLRFLEPLLLIPANTDDLDSVLTLLVVQASSPPEVAAVETVVRSLLPEAEPGAITVETSAQLAAIRAAIDGELRVHSRSTVLGILSISAVLVAANLLALVTLRRKDFGRRRALGATRTLVFTLVLSQVIVLAVAGSVLGTAATVAGLAVSGDPLPGAEFTLAVAVAAILAAAIAAVAPAVIAARRDPLHELRVP